MYSLIRLLTPPSPILSHVIYVAPDRPTPKKNPEGSSKSTVPLHLRLDHLTDHVCTASTSRAGNNKKKKKCMSRSIRCNSLIRYIYKMNVVEIDGSDKNHRGWAARVRGSVPARHAFLRPFRTLPLSAPRFTSFTHQPTSQSLSK